MKSAIAHLGTQNFPRLRIGIGKAQGTTTNDSSTVSYVLGRFSSAENQIVSEVLHLVLEAVELAVKQGIEKAMNRYNNSSISVTQDKKQVKANP